MFLELLQPPGLLLQLSPLGLDDFRLKVPLHSQEISGEGRRVRFLRCGICYGRELLENYNCYGIFMS
jgi:hypothetical protein